MEKVTKFWISQGFRCINRAFPFPLPLPRLCSWPSPSLLWHILMIPFLSCFFNFQLLFVQDCSNWWRTAPQIIPVKRRAQHSSPSCVPEQDQPILRFWEARGAAPPEVGWWCCCKELWGWVTVQASELWVIFAYCLEGSLGKRGQKCRCSPSAARSSGRKAGWHSTGPVPCRSHPCPPHGEGWGARSYRCSLGDPSLRTQLQQPPKGPNCAVWAPRVLSYSCSWTSQDGEQCHYSFLSLFSSIILLLFFQHHFLMTESHHQIQRLVANFGPSAVFQQPPCQPMAQLQSWGTSSIPTGA